MAAPYAEHQATVFEAFIVPHRSLSPRGVGALIVVLMVLLALVALRCWLLGAWPVVICSLLEVPLVALLLAINIHRARASELILLNTQELTVTQVDPKGRRISFSMPTAWLRVDHENAKGASRIFIKSRGAAREIGAFLHEAEKQSLARALGEALHGVKHPWFDNPQLRGTDGDARPGSSHEAT